MENFLLTIACLFIGWLLKRQPAFPDNTGNVLNQFVFYVSFPAVILLKIPELEFSFSLFTLVFLPWVMLFITAGCILLLAKVCSWSRGVTGSMLLVIPLGNTSFFGVPMVQTFFGDHAISWAILYDQLGSCLALATYGSVIIAFYGGREGAVSFVSIMKSICRFPPFLALLMAFVLCFFPLPQLGISLLEVLGATLVPVVMIAVGFQLQFSMEKKRFTQFVAGLGIKLVAAPLMAFVLLLLVGVEGEIADAAVFEAGMPPMVSAGALAILHGLAPRLTAAMVGGGILVSCVTLPLLYQLVILC